MAILVVAIVFGATDAADLPTRQALVADLVERHLVVNAVALGAAAMSATRIVGPRWRACSSDSQGPRCASASSSVAYLAPIVVLLTVIPDVAPLPRAGGHHGVGRAVAGLRVAAADPLIRGVVIVASVLAFCGVSYMPFLPVLARTQLHVGPEALGIMYSVGGIGGLVGGLAIASMGRGAGRLQLMLVGGVVYAASLFVVAHGTVLVVTLPALVGISFAFVAVSTSMTTLLQTDTDPALRGQAARYLRDDLCGIAASRHGRLRPDAALRSGSSTRSASARSSSARRPSIVVVTPSFRARVSGLEHRPSRSRRGPRYTGLRMFHRRGGVAVRCGRAHCPGGAAAQHRRRRPKPSPVIARVGHDPITLAQFNIRYQSALRQHRAGWRRLRRAGSDHRSVRTAILRSLIIDTVIREEATKLGLEATPRRSRRRSPPTRSRRGHERAQDRARRRRWVDRPARGRDQLQPQRAARRERLRATARRHGRVDAREAARTSAPPPSYSRTTPGTGSAKGGDLGVLTAATLKTYDPAFAAAVESLPVGKYTKTPVHDAGGYDIVMLYSKSAKGWGVRHILIYAGNPYSVMDRPDWFAEVAVRGGHHALLR